MVTSLLGQISIIKPIGGPLYGVSAPECFHGSTFAVRVTGTSSSCAMDGSVVQALRPIDQQATNEVLSSVVNPYPYRPSAGL